MIGLFYINEQLFSFYTNGVCYFETKDDNRLVIDFINNYFYFIFKEESKKISLFLI